jgi:hypothetical protein
MIGIRIMAVLALIGASTNVTLNTQQMYAITGEGNLGQRALGGASGVTTGAGSAGQSGTNVGGVDRHLFCNTGVITPICK